MTVAGSGDMRTVWIFLGSEGYLAVIMKNRVELLKCTDAEIGMEAVVGNPFIVLPGKVDGS